MKIRIETLGRLDVLVGGEDLRGVREQPIRAALLLFLSMEREATRDQITGVLWPDQAPDRARHTLSQTLYRLRQDLGEDWVTSRGEFLRVADFVRVDALEFLDAGEGSVIPGPAQGAEDPEAASSPSVQPTIALYRGPFLEGWGFSVSNEFEHWCDRQRFRLSRLHRELCRKHIAGLRAAGAAEAALALVQHWVEVDPMEDEAHHLHMELLAESGRRTEALNAFEAYQDLLASDDLEPLEETLELVKRIRGGGGGPTSEGAGTPLDDPVSKPTPPAPGPATTAPTPATSRSRKITVWQGALGTGLAGLLFLGALWAYDHWREPTESSPTRPVPNRVLVVSLENRTDEPDLASVGWLAADWITRGLSDLDFLEVRPASEFMAMETGTGSEAEALETGASSLATRVGAGILVSGTYYRSGPGLEFHVQILALPGGEVMEAIGPVRTETLEPMEAIDIIRQRVAVALAILLEENLEPLSASALPPSMEAYKAYSSGARKFVQGDRRDAVADLEEAYHRSPDFTAPLIYAAFGRLGLGDARGADSLARILEADKDNLPPYDAYRLELLQARLEGDNAEAYRAVRRAWELLDGGSAHYMSAQMALELNRPREALEVLETFDISRGWAQAWAPYWNVVTVSHHLLGDHREELEAASEGYRLNPDRMLMLAWTVRALAALGRWDEIQTLTARARSIRGPDPMDPGTLMVMAARELRRHGHDQEATASLEEAQRWVLGEATDGPAPGGRQILRARRLYEIGSLQQELGLEESTATLHQARLEFETLAGANPGEPDFLGPLGAIHARRGEVMEARRLSDSLQALDGPYLRGRHTSWQARIAALLGNREEAVRLLWQAVGEGVPFGIGMHADPDLESLRAFPPFQEFMDPKG